ncbi:hypothetical protein [Phenylobacterium sp.]|uniref:hypothetical protein n=1 Tax=Phenylobacterium sp. TaxID=1871053 RepID=UPI0025D4ADBC|nr:hypothetical protein [Phenylobacterium sp.]
MSVSRAERARRLAPSFEVQLRFARRMSELTGRPLGETALNFTHLHRRFALGVPGRAPISAVWAAFAHGLDAADSLAAQLALTRATFLAAPEEPFPMPGQTAFGCFADEPPNAEGVVRVHFYNRDSDAAGGPLARAKSSRRRADLAALARHVAQTYPDARRIAGRSWLYNLEAYRRLFPPDYAASCAPASEPVHLVGTSSWGQLIDRHETIRPDVRDALLANLDSLDPAAPWRAFPHQVLVVSAPVERFTAHFGV